MCFFFQCTQLIIIIVMELEYCWYHLKIAQACYFHYFTLFIFFFLFISLFNGSLNLSHECNSNNSRRRITNDDGGSGGSKAKIEPFVMTSKYYCLKKRSKKIKTKFKINQECCFYVLNWNPKYLMSIDNVEFVLYWNEKN